MCYLRINKIRVKATTNAEIHKNHANHATCSTICVRLYVVSVFPISNHSHNRQLEFATHGFSQKVLQQAV